MCERNYKNTERENLWRKLYFCLCLADKMPTFIILKVLVFTSMYLLTSPINIIFKQWAMNIIFAEVMAWPLDGVYEDEVSVLMGRGYLSEVWNWHDGVRKKSQTKRYVHSIYRSSPRCCGMCGTLHSLRNGDQIYEKSFYSLADHQETNFKLINYSHTVW